ncbi:ATP-dependent Clp protease proteolytic subunit [Xenorhabdus beddingii]|uniref:ATP-dependent Clp protease proteolytic subunit n=1 Tax=Xenorhabdus beddingii TaxID=40578 RepID=A0A1Y2STT7_9GAMM|nr:ATP-dependent Clp protease proteolytic subunit [Xenorhabdus beddingii]OTA21770.1 ATP-dependent Clp protease proteolytic subunit [Xenorhabdus beddingii]
MLLPIQKDDEEKKEPDEMSSSSLLIQQKMLDHRSIIISGEINQTLTEKVVSQLLLLQGISDAPIKIYINSQGGHVEAADTIHDMIKFIKPEVHIIGTGWVASAGITIFLAAKKEHRYALPNTRFMIHQPLGGVRGPATDIEIEAKEIVRMLDRVNQLIADATGQPIEKVKQDTDRNYWMNPKEAIDYGIVGQIVSKYEELDLDK